MKRSKFSLSNLKLLSMQMGNLVPINLVEVLPGDTLQGSSSALVRVSPLVAPLMHPVTVRVHHWFVPHRIVWTGWESFITGGEDGAGDGNATLPTVTAQVVESSLDDYLGMQPHASNQTFNSLPRRAYNKIYNEWYRDQDFVNPVPETTGAIQPCAWEKDYFTSARPWPQRGTGVTVPLGGQGAIDDPIVVFSPQGGGTPTATDNVTLGDSAVSPPDAIGYNDGGVQRPLSGFVRDDAVDPGTFSVDMLALREALGLQRYREARARYGARYTEYLRYLGVTPADARLQRPEYLGGGKQTIAFSEVLQTSNDGTNGAVGDMAGHGVAAVRSNRYRKFFQEHGYVITLMSVRPKVVYMEGNDRTFYRSIKEDFYQRELADIGQQEIFKGEVVAQASAADRETWGYQDRYDEYRRQRSTVGGEFRTTLDYWHLARDFGGVLPTLGSSFTNCAPGYRVFADTDSNTDKLWVMVHNRVAARRMMRKSGGNSFAR